MHSRVLSKAVLLERSASEMYICRYLLPIRKSNFDISGTSLEHCSSDTYYKHSRLYFGRWRVAVHVTGRLRRLLRRWFPKFSWWRHQKAAYSSIALTKCQDTATRLKSVRHTHARALYSDAKINFNPSSCGLGSTNSVYKAYASSSEGCGHRSCVVKSRNKSGPPGLVSIVEQGSAYIPHDDSDAGYYHSLWLLRP
jgi:hypothetical protein